LGAFGDGGIAVTNDDHIADSLMMLRNYGQRKKYYHSTLGFNRRLDTLQAAMLRVKLRHLDEWNASRRRIANQYHSLLSSVEGVTLPVVQDEVEPVWHLYVIQVEDRDGLQQYLREQNIDSGIHYPVPIHLQEAYESLGYERGRFPITEQAADRIVSLPMYPELTSESVERVAKAVTQFVTKA
jgi:dTDP-4-amino-4,6-dideoxygalactose transaminase